MSDNPHEPDLMAEGLEAFATGDRERGLALMGESNRRVRAWLDAKYAALPPAGGVVMKGRWRIEFKGLNPAIYGEWPQAVTTVPVVPCDDAAVERGARALWDVYRQDLPGKGAGMEPPWGDRESGQTAHFYAQAETVLRAAGEPS